MNSQSPTPQFVNIPKSATTFRSFAGVADLGRDPYPFLVRFPTGTAATPDPSCEGENSGYELFRYPSTGDANTPYIWQGPLTGPLQREPGGIYVTTNPYQHIVGLAFDGAFGGSLLENTSPAGAVSQTIFVHQNYCYDGGSELGFYRRLTTPGSTDETATMYLYYSVKSNCTGFATAPLNSVTGTPSYQTSCLIRGTTDQWDSQEFAQVAIPMLQHRNSQGRLNYRYIAFLTSPTTLRIDIRDPFTHNVLWTASHDIAPFFLADAANMWQGLFTAYVTFGIQKALSRGIDYQPLGDITADPADVPFTAARAFAVAQASASPVLS